MAFLNVRNRTAALLNRGDEINHVPSRRGSGVQLDVLLRFVFGKLFAFKKTVEVNRLGVLV